MKKKFQISNSLKNINDVYIKYDFNPVEHNILNINKLKQYEKQRLSLLEDFLKLPHEIFRNKNIIEFGSASGEKTLIYSLWGSKITVVEPNIKFIKQIKKNFNYYKKNLNIKKKRIENYNLKQEYNFVILENFLSSIKDRNKNLNKVAKLLKKDGYLIFNYHNKIGFFNEYIKKFVISYFIYKEKVIYLDQAIKIAKKLLFDNFKKINYDRSFERYVCDQFLITNFLDKTFWSIKEIFKIINKNKLRYYSSYPAYGYSKQNWHKEIKNNLIYNQDIYNKYCKEEKNFIDKKYSFKNEDKIILNKILNLLIKSCKKNQFDKNIKEITRLLKSNKTKNKYFSNLKKLFTKIDERSFKNFLKNSSWGYPNHYLVFKKV